MLRLRKVAITGGLSSGKTSCCRILKKLGASVINADEIAHQLLITNERIKNQVCKLLGDGVINEGILEHSKIAKKVYKNPKRLQALEEILHPTVYEEIDRRYEECLKENTSSLFVVELPLLYETKQAERFDVVVTVYANQSLCQNRYESKYPQRKDFKDRMKRQLSSEAKALLAHFFLSNEGTLDDLEKETTKLYHTLLNFKT